MFRVILGRLSLCPLLVFLVGGAALELQMQHLVLLRGNVVSIVNFQNFPLFQAKLVGDLGVWVHGWW